MVVKRAVYVVEIKFLFKRISDVASAILAGREFQFQSATALFVNQCL